MIIITPNTQLIYFSNSSFPSGQATSTSTSESVNAGGASVRLFWPKKKYYEFMDELEAERKARQAGLSWLDRVDDDLHQVDAILAAAPENLRPEYAATARRAELLKERVLAERDQKVRALAAEIKARRAKRD